MSFLITGTAGFIGNALALALLESGEEVVGIDSLNDYYDVCLKKDRLGRLVAYDSFTECRFDITDSNKVLKIFNKYNPKYVIHLAAQAGVRYSIENPKAYIDSNIVGFFNILESCRAVKARHLVYASSSSVYGLNKKMPCSVGDNANHPISLYAATKRSNELMAHSYSALYDLPTTGGRFFTVYGPWGRPDMSYFKFVKAILEGNVIQIYGNGEHSRDFTYIDDIVSGLIKIIFVPAV